MHAISFNGPLFSPLAGGPRFLLQEPRFVFFYSSLRSTIVDDFMQEVIDLVHGSFHGGKIDVCYHTGPAGQLVGDVDSEGGMPLVKAVVHSCFLVKFP